MSLFADIAANADKRFFFLMGETGDEFGLPFGRVPLDHLLLLHLRKQEYERVVFFGGAKNQIRHADYRSARVTASVGQPLGESSRNTRPTRAMRLVSGPLGSSSAGRSDQRGGQQQASSNEANEGQKPSLQFGSVNVEAIRTLDVWMQDNIPTAVVFPDAYDLVRHLDDDAVRLFSSCLNEWARLPGDNSNVAVFVFGVRELQELDQILQKDHRFETLRTHVFDAKGVLRRTVTTIGSPRRDEIAATLNALRIKQGSESNHGLARDAIDALAFNVRTNRESLKSLVRTLSTKEYRSKPFREVLHMIAKPRNPVSALERIRALKGIGPIVAERIEDIVEDVRRQRTADASKAGSAEPSSVLPDRFAAARRSNQTARPRCHMAIVGNPGTGKTMVAGLIAEAFRENGVLESGHLIEATKQDLVGQYVGETAIKTQRCIEDAIGGVLFIDEAYQLNESDESGHGGQYGREAIETIMEQMTAREGEFAVIIAGYEDRIRNLLGMNPGLPRRFPEANFLRLPDYSPELLLEIFEQKVRDSPAPGLGIDAELRALLPGFFKRWHAKKAGPGFGNVGAVENLIEVMKQRATRRLKKGARTGPTHVTTLTRDDVPSDLQELLVSVTDAENLDQILHALDDLTGLAGVKANVRSMVNTIRVEKLRNPASRLAPGHFLFTGAPGTGKTTVARLLGRIFWQLGMLGKGDCVEVSREGLVDRFSGHTDKKTKAVCERALDCVLFIDEAHQLISSTQGGSDDTFGREAVGALNKYMEDHRDRICVIAAGYPDEMERLFSADPGLRSRFTHKIVFEDYSAQEMLEIFKGMVTEGTLALADEAGPVLRQIFEEWERHPPAGFANARDVRNLYQATRTAMSDRLVSGAVLENLSAEELKTIVADDIKSAVSPPT